MLPKKKYQLRLLLVYFQDFILLGVPDPAAPLVHPSETSYAICEAAKRGDIDIIKALIDKKVNINVVGIRSSGGCGVGSLRKATPLAEALLAQYDLVLSSY